MGQQSVRQAARRMALDAQAVLRKERADRERRLEALAVAVLTALGERDALVRDAERRCASAADLDAEVLDYLADTAPLDFVDGYVQRFTGPGLGLDIDEAAVREADRKGHAWRNPVWRTLMGAWQSGDDPRTGPGLSPIWRSRRPARASLPAARLCQR
jgi:hypothetical protein